MIMMYAAAWNDAFSLPNMAELLTWSTLLFEILILYVCTLKFKNDLKTNNFF